MFKVNKILAYHSKRTLLHLDILGQIYFSVTAAEQMIFVVSMMHDTCQRNGAYRMPCSACQTPLQLHFILEMIILGTY